MTGADPALVEAADAFGSEIGDLLGRTVVDDPPIGAQVAGDRVLVGAFDDDGNTVNMRLTINDHHRLDLRVWFRCTFDFTGSFLAIEQSEFALLVPAVRHPVARFDYVRARSWASAHVQLHAESSAVGFLLAHAGKAPRHGGSIYLSVVGGSDPHWRTSSSSRSSSSTWTRRMVTHSGLKRDGPGCGAFRSKPRFATSSRTTLKPHRAT